MRRLLDLSVLDHNVITASVDNLEFIQDVYQNEFIVLIGTVTYVGNTSMEICVDTYVKSLDGIQSQVNPAYVTLVVVDEERKPTKVPGLILESTEEQAEWKAGKKKGLQNLSPKKKVFSHFQITFLQNFRSYHVLKCTNI